MKVIGQIAHEETVEHGHLKLGTTATTALAGNTAYDISCVDGANSDEENIRLTKSFAGTNITSITDDVVLEAGTGLSIARSGDKITFTNTETDTVLTSEQVEDIIGAMVTGNTETNIAVTYDDAGGKLNFVSTDTDTVYTHPTGAGSNHIPSGGSSGQFLKYASAGTATWAADNDTTYSIQDGELSQNNFTTTLKTKLDGIAASANNYSHPTGNGNNHIPADGASGEFLKYSSAGTAVWAADNNTTYSEATGSSEGLMSTAHHDKLDNIEAEADVTDATNVAAAGALMDSEVTDLAGIKALTVSSKANLASPTFTGVPAAPTAAAGTNTTQIATTAHVKASIDEKYAYTYLAWSASATPSRDGSNNPEWMVPNINKGIFEEDWNRDTGVTATATGTTTFSLTRYSAVNAIIIPHAGILVGFHAIGRNANSDLTFKAGLFHADNGLGGAGADGSAGEGIDYGRTGSNHEFTLRCVATADETEASGGTDGTTSHSFQGPCQLISNSANLTVQAGDAILPAIMGNSSNSTDEIYITMTIILKMPVLS